MNVGKKNILLILSIALFILLLGACEQDSSQKNSENDNDETSKASANQDSDDEAQDNKVENPDIEVTLLGTGGPQLFPDRVGYSTLVEAAVRNYYLIRVEASCKDFMNPISTSQR